jgi:hypothetical protein
MARWHFPRRNRLMAQLAQTIRVEAGPTNGTRHHLDACIALGRPVLVRAALLGQGIDWLDAADRRRQLSPWQEPLDALRWRPEMLVA